MFRGKLSSKISYYYMYFPNYFAVEHTNKWSDLFVLINNSDIDQKIDDRIGKINNKKIKIKYIIASHMILVGKKELGLS